MKRARASTNDIANCEPLAEQRRLGGRPKHTAWMVVIATGAFLCLLAMVIWQMAQPPAISTVRLRDGSRIILGGFSYGANQIFDTRSPLERLIQSFQPEESRSGPWKEKSTDGATTMWLHNRPLANGVTPVSNQNWTFVDEDGCPIDGGDFLFPTHVGLDVDLWIPANPPNLFSNGRGYGVRGYYGDTKHKAFEFYAPPAPAYTRPEPQKWTAHTTPQTVVTEQVTATLRSVTGPKDVFDPCYRAEIKASEVNSEHTSWDVIAVSTHDRYGGEMPTLNRFERRSYNTGTGFAFYGLCRREPVWKLTALLVPRAPNGVKPDFIWDLDLILPDSRHGSDSSTRRFTSHGVSIELRGPSRYLSQTYGVGDGRLYATYSLTVRAPGWSGGIAISDPGSRATPKWLHRPGLATGTDSMTHITTTDPRAIIAIPYRRGQRSINIPLAAYSARQADFYVKPPNDR